MWEIDISYIEEWIHSLDNDDAALLAVALQLLAEQGPMLNRPLVGKITTSTVKNMKELRPASTGRSEMRILFVFDPNREAIMLLAVDKAAVGRKSKSPKWNDWYEKAIPIADTRYEEHLKNLGR